MDGQISSLQAIFRLPAKAGRPESPWERLATDFPAVALVAGAPPRDLPALTLAIEPWESQNFNFHELDGRLDALAESRSGPFALVLLGRGEDLRRSSHGVLTRCQRWMDRRNAASRGELFDRVLAEHRRAHDLAKPLVRADYNHALDTWQWMLRLAPDADLASQLAALLHDAERLVSEADARVEHRAADYQAFKDEHAESGAKLAETLLAKAGVGAADRLRAARLIAVHERPPEPGDADAGAVSLLNDADALSFLSLNSVGYLDYFGPEQTRKKVAYTLRRLRPESRRYLDGLRLRPLVAAAVAWELETQAA
jgi:hypothetical protein